MKMRVFKKNIFLRIFSGVRTVFFTLVIFAIIFAGISQAAAANKTQAKRVLEEAIMRAAVHSYAVNGYFPPSLEYIRENFGVHTGRFVVHYEVFAANLLPFIRVFDR